MTDKYTEQDIEDEEKNAQMVNDEDDTNNNAVMAPKTNEEKAGIIGPSFLGIERQNSGDLEDNNTEKLTRILKKLKDCLRQYQSAVRLKTSTQKFKGDADFGTAATLVEHINMFLEELAAPGLKSIVLVALNSYGKSHLLNLLLHLGETLPSKYGKQTSEETIEKIIREICEENSNLYEKEDLADDAEAMEKFINDVFDIYHSGYDVDDDEIGLEMTTMTTTTVENFEKRKARSLGEKGFVIKEPDEKLYQFLCEPEQLKDEKDALEEFKTFCKTGRKGDPYNYILPAGNEIESTTNCGIKLRYHSQWAMAITYESIDEIKKMIVRYLNNGPDPTSKQYKRCMVLLHAIKTGRKKDEEEFDTIIPDEEDFFPKSVTEIETIPELCRYDNKTYIYQTKNENLMVDRMYIREVLEKFTSTNGTFEEDETNPSMFIKSVIVWAPSEILSESIELNDVPGVDDPNSMRDNSLRVGLENADQIIAMTERGLNSAEKVSKKLKEFGIARELASISPFFFGLAKKASK